MSWGRQRRTNVSNKLSGKPHRRDGGNGDTQIRQTNLGAKLFGKIGSNWYDTPLSIDGVTRIGTTISDHLAISRDDITIIKDNAKVASFGENINLFGKIIIGKDDGTFDTAMNINIGSEQSGLGSQNVCIGYQTGEDLINTSVTQILIGYQAGKEITGVTQDNICIGRQAGDTITGGDFNICLGYRADVTGVNAQNQVAIGKDATCSADNTTVIGNTDIILDAAGDIVLDSATGVFEMKGAGATAKFADMYAGMILGYTKIQNDSTTSAHRYIELTTGLDVLQTGQSTNVSIAFVVPPSGNVEIEFSCNINSSSKTATFALSDNSTFNEIDETHTYDAAVWKADETDTNMLTVRWAVTGLTAGASLTYYIAGASNADGVTYIYHGRNRGTGSHYPPIVVKATALPATIVTGE